MTSKAYVNWMNNQERIKVLIKFYPWAVHEVHDMWTQCGGYEKIFPDHTVFEALHKLDVTLKPILSFGIVQLVSIFETYLGDKYSEIIKSQANGIQPFEFKLNDEYKVRLEEFGDELNTYIAQERERFMSIPFWKNRLNNLMEKLEKILNVDDLTQIEEIFEVRNLLVHHEGKVTARYLKKFSQSLYIRDDIVNINKKVVYEMMDTLQNFVYYRIEDNSH